MALTSTAFKKIMVADDDQAIVDAVEMMLSFEGYQVETTYDGAKVLEIKQNPPDLVLLDIWMSGIDGRDICKSLKSNDFTRDIPVLMFSASKEIGQSALDSGADDFLAKPFEMDHLLLKVSTLLNKKLEFPRDTLNDVQKFA